MRWKLDVCKSPKKKLSTLPAPISSMLEPSKEQKPSVDRKVAVKAAGRAEDVGKAERWRVGDRAGDKAYSK